MTKHHSANLLLASLTLAGGLRHPFALGHLIRTACIASRLAGLMGLEEAVQQHIYLAAPVHDVGKLGIPDNVLLKPVSLTQDEQQIMQRHSSIGADLLAGSADALLQLAASVARHHHEHFDGSGYPGGLVGDDIPLAARVVAVADAFDAMIETRVYRQGMKEDEALAVLADRSGTHFDPRVVEVFLRNISRVRRIHAVADELILKNGDVRAVSKFYGSRCRSLKFFEHVRAVG